MNWKIIILTFAISLFAFIFITSGYSYKEGFSAKYMKMLKEKQMKQAKEKQMKLQQEKQNQMNQLNQMNRATRAYERKQINQIRSNENDTNRMKQNMNHIKQIANLSINKAVSENNNIVNQLNRMSDLIYNTLNPNKRRQTQIISSNPRPSVRPNWRSVRRPMPKRKARARYRR